MCFFDVEEQWMGNWIFICRDGFGGWCYVRYGGDFQFVGVVFVECQIENVNVVWVGVDVCQGFGIVVVNVDRFVIGVNGQICVFSVVFGYVVVYYCFYGVGFFVVNEENFFFEDFVCVVFGVWNEGSNFNVWQGSVNF